MRLAEFIRQNKKDLVAEWEAFAATLLPAAEGMTPLALRDHVQEILQASPGSRHFSDAGGAVGEVEGRSPESCAPARHGRANARRPAGSGRLRHQPARRRVPRTARKRLRLWIDSSVPDYLEVEDIIRFNEAIDQAVAESVGHFHAHVERARNLLLGMLGHDMRSPLNTILTTASYLAALSAGSRCPRRRPV